MQASNRVLLGHVAGAHGIRGEVLIKSYTDDPGDIASYGPLQDEAGTRSIVFKSARPTPKGIIARIEGVEDRNAAEALRGTKLFVDRAALPEPDEDEFYHTDLIGLKVVTTDGTDVGEVVAIQNYGAGDLLEYRLTGQKRTELVPFTAACVPDIDLEAGRVTVVLPDTIDVTGNDPEST